MIVVNVRVRLRFHILAQFLNVEIFLLLLQLQLPGVLVLLVLVADDLLLRLGITSLLGHYLVIHKLEDLGLHVLLFLLNLLNPLVSVLQHQLLLQLVPIADVQQVHEVNDGGELDLHIAGNAVLLQDGFLRVMSSTHSHVSFAHLLHHRSEHLNHSKRIFSSHAIVNTIQRLLLLLRHNVKFNILQLLIHGCLKPVGILRDESPPKDKYLC